MHLGDFDALHRVDGDEFFCGYVLEESPDGSGVCLHRYRRYRFFALGFRGVFAVPGTFPEFNDKAPQVVTGDLAEVLFFPEELGEIRDGPHDPADGFLLWPVAWA